MAIGDSFTYPYLSHESELVMERDRLIEDNLALTARAAALEEALQRIDSIRNDSCYAKTCGQMVAIARAALSANSTKGK